MTNIFKWAVYITVFNIFLIYVMFSSEKYSFDLNKENENISTFVYEKPKESVVIKVFGFNTATYGSLITDLYNNENILIKVSSESEADFIFSEKDKETKLFSKHLKFAAIEYIDAWDQLILFNSDTNKTVYHEYFLYKYLDSHYNDASQVLKNNHLKYFSENDYNFSEKQILKDFVRDDIKFNEDKKEINIFYVIVFCAFLLMLFALVISIIHDYFEYNTTKFWSDFEDNIGVVILIFILNIGLSPFII